MELLFSLIKSLKPKEKRYLRRLYLSQPNGEDKKRLALLEILLEGKVMNDKEVAAKIYGGSPNSAFSHMKRRLKEDLLNFLLIQDSSKQFKSKKTRDWIDVNKMIIQGEILLSRGIFGEARKIFEKALMISEENELLSEVIRIKIKMRESFGSREGLPEYLKYSSGVDIYLEEFVTFSKVRDFFFKVRLPNVFETNKLQLVGEYESIILELRDRIKGSSLDSTKFFYFLSEITFWELKRDYSQAIYFAENLKKLIESSPRYKSSKNDIAGANMTISNLLILKGDYSQAEDYAKIAMDNFIIGRANELRAMEFLFFALLRQEKYEKALDIVEQALLHDQIEKNLITKGKWLFFKSATYFNLADVNISLSILRENTYILKDKTGWVLGYRILEMMIAIENRDYYLVTFLLNNYYHHLNRIKEANTARAKIIGQILRSYMRYGDDLKLIIEKNANKIKLLSDQSDDFFWNPLGYEIVRFDQWLLNRV